VLILSGSESEFLQMAEIIVDFHHERRDGSSYPKGQKGEAPSSLTDCGGVCLDALISDCPYKKAWPIEKTVAEMESPRGKSFDPHVFRVFTTLLLEMAAISRRFSDSSQQIVQAQRKTY